MNKIFFCDVDGSLTNGKIYLSNFGIEFSKYSISDGMAFEKLKNSGFLIYIISGRKVLSSYWRLRKFGIKKFYFNVKDKEKIVKNILSKAKNNLSIYFGDEDNDLLAMKQCSYVGSPSNSSEKVKKISNFVSKLEGGSGALKDFYDSFISKIPNNS
jgi:3-deoxy-D-manno-octulosonate 8-phosphate phosphatase (KDO 8-P phosphatase)